MVTLGNASVCRTAFSCGHETAICSAAGRSHFPTQEECFFNEAKEGARYTVGCGTAAGQVTTVRYR